MGSEPHNGVGRIGGEGLVVTEDKDEGGYISTFGKATGCLSSGRSDLITN